MALFPLNIFMVVMSSSILNSETIYRGGPRVELWQKIAMPTVTIMAIGGQIAIIIIGINKLRSNRSNQSLKGRM